MINYKNDPLLCLSEFNYMVDNIPNYYKALIFDQDFTKEWIRKTPYIKNKELTQELYQKIKTRRKELEKIIKEYACCNYPLRGLFESLKRQMYQGRMNIIVLRCISFLQKEKPDITFFKESLSRANIVSNYQGKSILKLPTKEDLISNEVAYLIGVIVGDGSIEKKTQKISICDGFRHESKLKYSLKHLQNIGRIINKFFLSKYFIRKKFNENTYELCVGSKWLGRLINGLFNVPIGWKYTKLQVPNLIKQQQSLLINFWRGLFDTDGDIPATQRQIKLGSKSKYLLTSLSQFLDTINIKNSGVREAANDFYYVFIPTESYLKFAEKIGSSHPRKILNLIYNLKRGPTNKRFYGIKNIYKNYFDLELLQNDVRLGNSGSIFKELRMRLGKSQQEMANILNYKQFNTIRRFEQGKRNPLLKDLIKLAKLNNYNKEQIYSILSGSDVSFYSGTGGGDTPITLPTKQDGKNIALLKFLKPISSINKIHVATSCTEEELLELEKLLSIKIKKDNKNHYYINSHALTLFLDTFFIFKLPWEPVNGDRLSEFNK